VWLLSTTRVIQKIAKRVAATLIRDVGFDPVEAGALRIARYPEPFALLMGELAYERESGPRSYTDSKDSTR
jgi:predicted dinucleotide-binding enzyme